MSVGWAVAILLLMLAVFYFRRRQAAQVATLLQSEPPPAHPQPVSAVELPGGYFFHPSHTWMAEHGTGMARVGLDAFAANVIGTVQHIAVVGEQRWVRQGQKLITVTSDCETIEMLSPLEGVVAAINPEVIKDPGLAFRDPYGKGWVCQIKSSEMETNERNLIQGPLAERWLEGSFQQLKSVLAEADPVLAQDCGQLLPGAFNRLNPERRKQLVKEFFQAKRVL
ncbi:MAG TPA: glycine cleavage system protein H [Terriglobales bacterium]|nr:glycine cleavage system protein H [Terriglobales bacterium]